MNAMALNTVYNHYLTSYAPKGITSYDTHKKSELRSVYNSIIKMNKESPLYLLDTSKETQRFAVNIKEGARGLRNTIASLGGLDEEELLNKKTAFSTNENIASAKFIGNYTQMEASYTGEGKFEPPSFEIEVKQTAMPQINVGQMLASDKMELSPNTYSFDIAVNDLNYEFQFNVNSEDTNKDIQERLSRLITNADIGIEASILEDGEGNSSLKLQSKATGATADKRLLFSVSDNNTSKAAGAVTYFGLDNISKNASDSKFLLNGIERSTTSNTFTVEKAFEITLNGISGTEGETASIGLKTDVESLTENINNLLGGYNNFIKTAAEHLTSQPKTGRLLGEMQRISSDYSSQFDSFGLHLNGDGNITVDEKQLRDSISSEDAAEVFSSIKEFTGSLLRKSNQVALNPMHYVDKTIVAYKNPGKGFANPYITSAYSGMMFNSYC